MARISFKTPFNVSREYYIIAICTLKTKIKDKKFLILIGLKKLRSPKNSAPDLRWEKKSKITKIWDKWTEWQFDKVDKRKKASGNF